MRDGGGHSCVERTCCLRKREVGVSLVDSLSEEDEAWPSLFPVKKIAHSFSLILGLTLVALVLIRLGIAEGMTDSLGSGAGWIFLTFFLGRSNQGFIFYLLESNFYKFFIFFISLTQVLQPLWGWSSNCWTHRSGHSRLLMSFLRPMLPCK